jgi:hypothetical protein
MIAPWPDPRFHRLTPELLASISADEIGSAVVQHVQLHAQGHPGAPHEGLDLLPTGVQAVYATWLVDTQVNHGGFSQFFFNASGALAGHALAGYELLGAEEYATVMRAAIATYEAERDRLAPRRAMGDLVVPDERRELDEVDQRYYALGDRIYAIWALAVRDRPDLFVR